MKAKAAKTYIYLFAAATVVVSFIQPTVIHQIVTWVAGAFCVLVVLALFAIDNWPQCAEPAPEKDQSPEAQMLRVIRFCRNNGLTDEQTANFSGYDIDVIKAVPR